MIAGLPELLAQLGNLENLDVISAETDGANVILPAMKENTPVRTGFLRDSEHLEVDTVAKTVNIVIDAPYAIDVEFGTSKMAAEPFARPAIDDKSSDALKAVADNLNRQLEQL